MHGPLILSTNQVGIFSELICSRAVEFSWLGCCPSVISYLYFQIAPTPQIWATTSQKLLVQEAHEPVQIHYKQGKML